VHNVHLHRADYAANGRRLLEWCMRRGADEFGLTFLGPPYLPRSEWARVDELLMPFRRRVASAGDRWALTGESIAVVLEVVGDVVVGGATRETSLHELTVYRGGEPLLRARVGEERWMLDLRADDEESLARSGLPYEPSGR
jgi:hypothetical protein